MSEALAAAKIRAYSVMVPVPVRFYARNAGQTLAKKSLCCSKTDENSQNPKSFLESHSCNAGQTLISISLFCLKTDKR